MPTTRTTLSPGVAASKNGHHPVSASAELGGGDGPVRVGGEAALRESYPERPQQRLGAVFGDNAADGGEPEHRQLGPGGDAGVIMVPGTEFGLAVTLDARATSRVIGRS